MTDVLEGWEGHARIKIENNSNNWSWSSTVPYDPYLITLSIDSSVDMERIYAIGTRTAIDTAEGVLELTGSVERPLLDNNSANQIVWNGTGTTHYKLVDVAGFWGTNVSKCAILVMPAGSALNITYVLHDVKFHDYSLGLTAEGVTKETASFTADNASTA